MPTLVIKTNVSQATDVTIRDMGIVIPNSGGSLTFTTNIFLNKAKSSNNLLTLATDDAHGAGSSTLILNDGSGDIAQADVTDFLKDVEGSQGITGLDGLTGLLGNNGVTGLVGLTGLAGAEGETGLQGVTGIVGADGNQGNTGLQGSTGLRDIANDIANQTGNITTTSQTDILATGMTLTPAAGTYRAFFTGSTTLNNDAQSTMVSIYSGGAQNAASETTVGHGKDADNGAGFCSIGDVTVNGSQAIEGRWRVSVALGNQGTMMERTLFILKLSD